MKCWYFIILDQAKYVANDLHRTNKDIFHIKILFMCRTILWYYISQNNWAYSIPTLWHFNILILQDQWKCHNVPHLITRGSQEPWSLNCLIFLPLGNNFNKELSDNFVSKKTLVGLIIRIISSIETFFLFIIVFNILTKNC